MAGKNFKQKILDLGSEIPKTLEYWRNPTKSEIKFGYGVRILENLKRINVLTKMEI